MTSRLERLFVLLESGSSSVTRRAAAQQLGEVQRLRPRELHRLLARVLTYLRSPAWETRIAAGQAIEAILKNVPQWDPQPCEKIDDDKNEEAGVLDSGRLRFDTFDIEKVLAQGAHLMGSEGKEYDMEEDFSPGMDIREKLARQRQLLNARLGLDVASKLGMDLTDVFSNEDLMSQPVDYASPLCSQTDPGPARVITRKAMSELVPSGSQLSSREINRARRKARQQKSVTADDPPAIREEPERKRFKGSDSQSSTKIEESIPVYGEWLPEMDGWGSEVGWWPLEGLACALAAELFSSQWEARHGAATALRDLLRTHGAGAGKEAGTTVQQMEACHQSWLEDISLRLLCVLALDRFGDFVSDQMVAPVRETCAQCLGVAASLSGPAGCARICSALAMLARQPHWEARHGALLGLKYLIAVQQELGTNTLAWEAAVRALWDPVEDVAAAAASALAPAARALTQAAPVVLLPTVARLRRLLRAQDELAAACGCFMALLAALLAQPEADKLLGPKYMATVVPRLWPYLSHPTSSVRRAALQTLRTLTQCSGTIFQSSQQPVAQETEPSGSSNEQLKIKSENDSLTNNVDITENQSLTTHDTVPTNGTAKPEIKAELDVKPNCDNIKGELNSSSSNSNALENGFFTKEGGLQDLVLEKDDDDNNECPDGWNAQLLQDALRHVFQRVLVEHIQDIKNIVEEVWNNLVRCSSLEFLLNAACPYVSTWICLTMQPAKIPFDPAHMIQSKSFASDKYNQQSKTSDNLSGLPGDALSQHNGGSIMCQRWYVGGSETTSQNIREANVAKTRCMAARMLGLLSCYIVKPSPGIVYTPDIESPVNCYIKILLVYLSSKSALQRLVTGLVISAWARRDQSIRPSPPVLADRLHQCLSQPIYFDEIALTCNRILQDTRDFAAMMRHYKVPLEGEECNNIVSLEQVVHFTGPHGQDLICKAKLKNRISQTLDERRKSISAAAIQCSTEQNTLNISTLAALAGACANLHSLPEKLNPVIKPLMESIKKEENEHLQQISAENLAELLSLCVERQPCPNVKVLVNLCTFLKSDSEFTPRISNSEEILSNGDSGSGESSVESTKKALLFSDNRCGILMLSTQQRQAERSALKRSNSSGPGHRGPGRPPNTDIPLDELFPVEDENQKQFRIQRRGATFALTSLTAHFGVDLPEKLPKLWEFIMNPLTQSSEICENITVPVAEDLISNLQVLEVVTPHIAKSLLPQILEQLQQLGKLLENEFKAVRHMTARCMAALADIAAPEVMHMVVEKVVPMLGTVDCDRKRQGAAEALASIVDKLQINIVPYIVLLVVPLLGRMSDHDNAVRLMSTHCFATLIQLMPLDGAIKEPGSLSEELKSQRIRDRVFLDQLFNPKSIGDYKIPVPISAELRSYQQAGVNWLAFLNKYKLHGVLCDDMGLGKTLQSICMVAGDHYLRDQSYAASQSPDCAPLPSLVICPPTLTGHWVYEINKFLSTKYLNPLHFMGPPLERERLKSRVKHHNLVVASYDIVRKDIDFFSSIKWNYCILDEGHIIKNGKTKASKAIKTIVANHRLILSGTPIQNNVLELWSLFDFLMPGLLGTERQFTARYSRPILAARDPRATPQHQEAGALAMEALHRQVLPFLLRRMKEDVLTELPPKICQDYYCDLSPLQRRLYEDFSRAHLPQGLGSGTEAHQHVFQALRYLQNVCNHPKLVLTPQHPEYMRVTQELAQQKSSLNDIEHSAKLPALKQLLQDCGIGCLSSDATAVLSQHRALIFCQLKSMLDVVERDLLRPLLPNVSYLRLDGAVPPGQRHAVVQRFNNDPSIDVLLLTTQVGGLGLNLTGADTVIFVEHDWNPMKDLQAMDRAHRIGQKKVVNVYRLITRATLEEKIMGLQKFKLLTASTVISSENASLETMGTDQLLDLFHLSDDRKGQLGPSQSGTSGLQGPSNMKTILDNLPDLWDDHQYEAEYDMANFIKSLSEK